MGKFLIGLSLVLPIQALTIQVDYRFDTHGFFDAPDAREAIEAVAARWSRVIDQTLLPVSIQDEDESDIRFSLLHPETGAQFQLSAAASVSSDYIVEIGGPRADQYLGGFTLEEDVWILFVGSRARTDGFIAAAGPLGLGVVVNLPGTPRQQDDPESLGNRGFNVGEDSLNVLGGSATFDRNTNWNFDLSSTAPGGGIDFYSIALHEVGHALGLGSRANPEWVALSSSGAYQGENALAAFHADNSQISEALVSLDLVSGTNLHWRDNIYQSQVFPFGRPSSIGVVSPGVLQDLLMEPTLSFRAGFERFEITNVEVGGLKDIGWSVITEDPLPLPVAFEPLESGGLSLAFQSEVGVIYTVQTSVDTVNWLDVSPSLVGNGGQLSWADGQEGFTDPSGNAVNLDGKYYRVMPR